MTVRYLVGGAVTWAQGERKHRPWLPPMRVKHQNESKCKIKMNMSRQYSAEEKLKVSKKNSSTKAVPGAFSSGGCGKRCGGGDEGRCLLVLLCCRPCRHPLPSPPCPV